MADTELLGSQSNELVDKFLADQLQLVQGMNDLDGMTLKDTFQMIQKKP